MKRGLNVTQVLMVCMLAVATVGGGAETKGARRSVKRVACPEDPAKGAKAAKKNIDVGGNDDVYSVRLSNARKPAVRKGATKGEKKSVEYGEDPKDSRRGGGDVAGSSGRKKQASSEKKQPDIRIEIVCKKCRKEKSVKSQDSLMKYFSSSPTKVTSPPSQPSLEDDATPSADAAASAGADEFGEGGRLVCSRCRRSMEEREPVKGGVSRSTISGVCPSITKLKGYKKTAKDKGIEWRLQDGESQRLMTMPCFFCGREASRNTDGFNGINRVNHSVANFTWGNVVPACKECNQMKHNHTVEQFVQICCHIATHNGIGDFGRFPHVFANNSSPRSPSSYLTKSKTHVLTADAFKNITASDCYYCGKTPRADDPGRHYNGLDRVDTKVRVYSSSSSVSCCGTCNTMKWRRTVSEFLRNCNQVASHAHRGGVTSEAACALRGPPNGVNGGGGLGTAWTEMSERQGGQRPCE